LSLNKLFRQIFFTEWTFEANFFTERTFEANFLLNELLKQIFVTERTFEAEIFSLNELLKQICSLNELLKQICSLNELFRQIFSLNEFLNQFFSLNELLKQKFCHWTNLWSKFVHWTNFKKLNENKNKRNVIKTKRQLFFLQKVQRQSQTNDYKKKLIIKCIRKRNCSYDYGNSSCSSNRRTRNLHLSKKKNLQEQ